MKMAIDVVKIEIKSVSDASGLEELINSGRMGADDILAAIGKTEGNGGVNDFTRILSDQAYRAVLVKYGSRSEEQIKEIAKTDNAYELLINVYLSENDYISARKYINEGILISPEPSFYSHLASGGSDIKMASIFPPVFKPNFVPLSYIKLNSTYRPRFNSCVYLSCFVYFKFIFGVIISLSN